MMKRSKQIIKISFIGLIMNILLVIIKGFIGFLANSIAIILDAINNLSDVLSSLITIVGVKMSTKEPDKEHPYGHGRIEYITSTIIAVIVMWAGYSSLKESIKRIINPEASSFSGYMIILIIMAIIIKFIYGLFAKRKGIELKSNSLIATGLDALGDAIITFSTLLGALITIFYKINIDGYLGVIISLLILKTAFSILVNTINDVIGVNASKELIDSINKIVMSFQEVYGIYDLVTHNYGPNHTIATANILVDEFMSAKEIHKLTKQISLIVMNKLNVYLTLGIYSKSSNKNHNEIYDNIKKLTSNYHTIKEIHGFFVKDKTVFVDIIFDFEENNSSKIIDKIKKELKKNYPQYDFEFIVDRNYFVY